MKSDPLAGYTHLAKIILSILKPGLTAIILPALFLEIAIISAFAQTGNPQNQGLRSSDGIEHATGNAQGMAEQPGSNGFDIPELLRLCEINGAAMHKGIFDYTYTLKKVRTTLNEQGKVKDESVELFEAYPVRGEHVLIKLSTDGEPVPPWRVRLERKNAGEQLMAAERTRENDGKAVDPHYISAGVLGNAHGKRVRVSIDLSEFLHSCDFFSPRQEKLDGRDTIVLRFQPRAGINLPSNKRYILDLAGVVWIDADDKVLVRLEGWPATEFAEGKAESHLLPDPNAALIYQQTRLDTGKWFPSLIRINPVGDLTLFEGLSWDVKFEFLDYKQFKVEMGDPKIKDPNDGK